MAKHKRLRKQLHEILLDANKSLTTSELMGRWDALYNSAYKPTNTSVALMLRTDKRFKNLTPSRIKGVRIGYGRANWVVAPDPELKALVGQEIPWKVNYDDGLPDGTFVADDIAWDYDDSGEWGLVELHTGRWMTLDQATEWIE